MAIDGKNLPSQRPRAGNGQACLSHKFRRFASALQMNRKFTAVWPVQRHPRALRLLNSNRSVRSPTVTLALRAGNDATTMAWAPAAGASVMQARSKARQSSAAPRRCTAQTGGERNRVGRARSARRLSKPIGLPLESVKLATCDIKKHLSIPRRRPGRRARASVVGSSSSQR